MPELYRAVFYKKGAISFLSHMDTVRLLQRAIKRARLPVTFSQGFNPHQHMGLALPLSTGMDGERELLEVKLSEALAEDSIVSLMNAQLPDGIKLVNVERLPEGAKTAGSLVYAAEYECVYSADIAFTAAVEALLASESLVVEKRSKSGVKEQDIRPDILSAEADGSQITLLLRAGSEKSVKPEYVLRQIFVFAKRDYEFYKMKITRKRLLLNGE